MSRSKRIMKTLRNRIEAALQNPERSPWFSLETLLLVLSMVYGAVMRLRPRLYESGWLPSRILPCRVLSIGNITAGGTGKTPMTIFIAQRIQAMGYRVAVISRGYRGELEDKGGVVSDGETILVGPEQAGDEPYLMASILRGVPVLVGRRRYEAGMLAVKRFQPDVILLDDAFQHLRLKRDLDLVLMDKRLPFGNGFLLPRGVLREPHVALKRAHAIVFTRCNSDSSKSPSHPLIIQRPVFFTQHRPVIRILSGGKDGFSSNTEAISLIEGKRAVCFAGLADNRQFFTTLQQTGCKLIKTFSFSDHHHYTRFDLEAIAAEAVKCNAEIVATPFKDGVKLDASFPWPVPLAVVDAQIDFFGNENNFLSFLCSSLQLSYRGNY